MILLLVALLPFVVVRGVEVVIATDRFTLPGSVVVVASVLNTTSHPLAITVVTPTDQQEEVSKVLRCFFADEMSVTVVGFDIPLSLLNETNRLEVPMNYARFYLDELFYPRKRIVVWLDADVVVKRDLNLLPTKLDHPVAAVPRQKILKLSRDVGKEDLVSFNAGVAIFDLYKWKRVDVFKWISLHRNSRLYQHSTNPPLILALQNQFDRLDPEWNCAGFGFHDMPALLAKLSPECTYNPAVLHWTGPFKPWLKEGKHRDLWLSHFPKGSSSSTCLTF